GGNTEAAYYGQISNPGVASWSSTSAYPIADNFDNPSECFQYNGYMYCVGGYTGSAISQVYYAPLTSGGIGSWIASANSYPIPNYATSCFAP
ncbi:MAG: hypothetical protein KGH78_05175, partial [Candidatus Micrarchaeota archaeon]|nr:hypothetical protein [Candidatus Micrarchaeota archaeon]